MGSLAGTGQKTLPDSEATHQALENSNEVHSSHPTMILQPLQSLVSDSHLKIAPTVVNIMIDTSRTIFHLILVTIPCTEC
jgi:hypothetical protein